MNDDSSDLDKELQTKNACIYSNERRRLSAGLLSRIDGVLDISSDEGLFRRPTCLKMRIGGDSLQLNVNGDRRKIKEHVVGMHRWVNRMHELSPIMNIDVFHKFIDQINQMYGVVVDSEFGFRSPIWNALLRIAKPIKGVIFVQDSFVDCDGRILFGFLADLTDEILPDDESNANP